MPHAADVLHAVTARIRHDASSIEEIYIDASRHDRRMGDLLRAAKSANLRIIQADDTRLDAMVGTRRHQGVVARAGELSLARNLAELLDAIIEDLPSPTFLKHHGVKDKATEADIVASETGEFVAGRQAFLRRMRKGDAHAEQRCARVAFGDFRKAVVEADESLMVAHSGREGSPGVSHVFLPCTIVC